MSCGCKSNVKTKEPEVRVNKGFEWKFDGNTAAKWATFVLFSVLSPLMLPFIVVALYYAIIKNKKLDVMQTFRVLLRTAINMRNKEQDALEELDLDSAEVLEKVVESVVQENV